MRNHGIYNLLGTDSGKRGSARRVRQAIAIAALAVFSVGCAVGTRVALPPLPVVALFNLLAATLPPGSTGASYGPATVSTNLTTSGTGTVSACQFVSPASGTPGSNTVPLGLQIAVGTPAGGAANTGCTISGVIGDTNGNGVIDPGEGAAPGTYTFTVRAADSSSPPQSDTQTYTIIVSSLQITLTDTPDPTVTGQSITVTWTFTVSGSPATPNQAALVELLNSASVVEDSCTGALTAGTCGALNSTTAGAHTIRLTYPAPPATDPNFPGTTTTSVPHTVNVAPTTTTVSTTPDPSVTGQTYAANVTVATNAPGGGAPTGTVAVSDGLGNTCNTTLTPGVNQSTGTCNLRTPAAGVTASYPGSASYAASMGTDPHTVNPAATTTTITADTPDPSVTGQLYTVNWTVTVNAPGAGTPTGTVTVDDGTGASCSAAVGAGTCSLTSVTAGAKVLTANYSGDANFNASAGTANHTVNQASTTTTITADTPDPSITGETYTVNATVDTTAPGTGQPTGTVTVDDGQGQSCMIALSAGPGANQGSGSCMLTSITTAVTQLSANYSGDANYVASLGTTPHTVTLAPTSTTITLITPSPSTVGQAANVDVTVAPNPPGTGAPTGSVMVDDGFGGTCTIAALTPGVNQSTGSCMLTSSSTSVANLTATYSGDANFGGSVGSLAHAVTASATTTTLVSSVNPSVSGETITYTATVAPVPPGTGTPTGTVQFRVGGLNVGAPVALAGGVASTMLSFNASVSPQSVDAVYSGDSNFGGSTSNLVSQVINLANTTSTITADTPDPTVTGEGYTVNWTVTVNAPGAGTPTGTVTVDDGAGGMCSNAVAAGSCLLVSPTAGGKMLIATYGGDADFNGSASASAAHTVNLASTTTTLMSSINPTVSGETSTFTATVAPVAPGAGAPTGSVQFRVNTVNVGAPVALVGGVASTGLAFPASVSPQDVDAVYSGDANFATSTSNTVTQVINQANTTTTLVSSANPSVSGETVTFTATVAPVAPGGGTPTGSVQFSINSVPVGGPVALVGGVASLMQSFTVATGPANVDAVYGGDADFAGSTSNTVVQTVNQASTTTALVSSANPSVSGETVTFTATVTANAPGAGTPTGNVVFRINTVAVFLAPLAGGVATFPTTFTVAASPEDVDAVYTGDTEFVASLSNNISQVTNQASTTTTVAGPGVATVTGETYLVTFGVSANAPGAGAPAGTVTVDDGTDSCTAAAVAGGCLLTSSTNGGAKTLTATYSGDPELAGSVGTAPHTVNQATTATAITLDNPDPTLAGEVFTVSWAVTINPPGAEVPPTVLGGTVTVRDTVNTADSCTAPVGAGGIGSCMLALSMVGARDLEAIYSGDASFSSSTSAAEPHLVNLASTTTTLVSSANPSVSGETVTFTATVAPVPPAGGTPTGTVDFRINTVVVAAGVPLVGGVASFMQAFTVAVSPEDVDAVYSGDANFNGSTSNTVTQVINQAASSTAMVSSANPSVSGQTVTFTATVTATAPGTGTPTGTVQFQINSAPVGAPVALVGGVATFMQSFTVAQSGDLVDAVYSGDTEFTGGNSNVVTQTVNPASTSTLVVANTNVDTFSGDAYTVDVTVVSNAPGGGEPDGDVDVDDGEGNTCNAVLVPGLPGTNTSSGSCMITSMTNGVVAKTISGNYNPGLSGEFAASSGTDAHNVNRATTTTTINDKQDTGLTGTLDPTVSGEDYVVLVTVNTTAGQGEATGNVLVQDDNTTPTDSCTAALVPGAPGSNTSTGMCTMLNSRSAGQPAKLMVADYQGDVGANDDFAISTSATFAHTVNKANTGMSGGADIVKSADPTVVGETYTVTVTVNASTGEGEPTGTVDVDDGFGGMCTLTLTPNVGLNNSTGSCMMTSTTTASTLLNANYAGDNDFNGVMASNGHTVNQASTTIAITSVNPAGGSLVNTAYTIDFSLTVNAPGSGSPTGTITVSDGTDNNACALPTTSCTLTSTTTGAKNLTATYSGDTDFNGSVSPNFPYAIVAMFIATTPAAPGGVMGNGTEDIAIGGGSGPDLVFGNADDGDGVLFQFVGGTGPFTCSLASGTLPTGVTVQAASVLTSGGANACALAGTPALGTAGMYVFDVMVQDSGVNSATTGNITWMINGPLFNTSPANLGDAVDQRNYTVTLSATGGQAPQLFSDNFGTLAADVDCVDSVGGLQFSFVLALNGDLTATPARLSDEPGADGVCNFTSQALSSPTSSTGLGPTGSGTEFVAHTITTQPALSFVTTAIPNAKKGLEYFPASLGGQPGAVIQSDGGTGTHFFDVTVGPFTLQSPGGIDTWVGDAGTECEGFSFPRDAAMILSPNALDTVVTGTSPRPGTFNDFSDTCTFTVQVNDTGSGPTGPDPAPPTQAFSTTIFNAMAFAAGFGTETLEVINTETNQFVSSIPLVIPGAGQPNQVAVSPDGRYVFTSSVSTEHIAVVDASTGLPITNSPFDVSANCNGPLGLATTLTATGVRRLFVGCSVNAGGQPDERVVTYDFNPAAGGSLTVVNTADFTGAGGTDHDPQGLAITPDGTTVFVVFRGTTAAGEWGMVDAATGAIIQNGGNDVTAFSPTCGSPGGVAIAQTAFAGNPVELYVACEGPDQIAIVNTATLAQAAANISVGANPNSIAFIPGANAARAYATLNGADQIAVIDTAARTATNLNLPSPDSALDTDSDPVGITIPQVPAAGTLRIYSCLSGAAAPSPGVNFIDDPATVASVGTTIGTTASSSPRGIRHIPVPRR